MKSVTDALNSIRDRIAAAQRVYRRPAGSVALLAVSKTQPASAVKEAFAAGQRAFGENQLQDALTKIEATEGLPLEWHFIGPIQSNKTRSIAAHFQWVHSVDRLRIAHRLNEQRPEELAPLNVCIQVNISRESSKSGVPPEAALDLALAIAGLPRLALRGLMAIPAPCAGLQAQRAALRPLATLLESLGRGGVVMDTLSMGMTEDLEAAVAEGATIVRVGTAIFGPRRASPAGR